MHRFPNRHILILLVLITVLFIAISAQAQEKPANRAGFFLGMNFANQGGDMDSAGQDLANELEMEIGGSWSSSKSSITGGGLGGFYTIQTSPTFGIQIEGQFIRRGTQLDLTGTDGFSTVTLETQFQLNYIEFPVLARFSPSPEAKFRATFMAGPVIGFLTSANLKMSAEGESESESISEGYSSTTVGLLGSIGFSTQVGETSYLTAQACYYQGLTNSLDDDDYEATSGDFGIFIGMEFLLKK